MHNKYSTAALSSPTSTFDIDLDDDEHEKAYEAETGDLEVDTLGNSAALQMRHLERERRLKEIDQTFLNVVEEADKQIRTASQSFTETASIHDEETIRDMEHQILASQPKSKAGKLKERALEVATKQVNRFTKNNEKVRLELQSRTAVGNFDDFLPQSGFRRQENDDVNKPYGVDPDASWVDRSGVMFNTIYSKANRHRSKIGLIALALLLAVASTVTVRALSEPPLIVALPEETLKHLKIIRESLIKSGFHKSQLHDDKTPQFAALAQLAAEATMKELSIDTIKKKTEIQVEKDDLNQPTSFNVAYVEQRVLIERYAVLTIYFETTKESLWKKRDNWLANDRHICDGWYGVRCHEFTSSSDNDGGKAAIVTEMNLASNKITGTLPDEICHLEQLEKLNLEGNNLSGNLPDCIGRLRSLQKLYISFNSFNGKVPDEVCDLRDNKNGMLAELVSDCGGGDKDDIECDCCTECL